MSCRGRRRRSGRLGSRRSRRRSCRCSGRLRSRRRSGNARVPHMRRVAPLSAHVALRAVAKPTLVVHTTFLHLVTDASVALIASVRSVVAAVRRRRRSRRNRRFGSRFRRRLSSGVSSWCRRRLRGRWRDACELRVPGNVHVVFPTRDLVGCLQAVVLDDLHIQRVLERRTALQGEEAVVRRRERVPDDPLLPDARADAGHGPDRALDLHVDLVRVGLLHDVADLLVERGGARALYRLPDEVRRGAGPCFQDAQIQFTAILAHVGHNGLRFIEPQRRGRYLHARAARLAVEEHRVAHGHAQHAVRDALVLAAPILALLLALGLGGGCPRVREAAPAVLRVEGQPDALQRPAVPPLASAAAAATATRLGGADAIRVRVLLDVRQTPSVDPGVLQGATRPRVHVTTIPSAV